MSDVEQMLRDQLKALGAEGLMLVDGQDGCGCTLDDLFPCGGENILECIAAKLVPCDDECDHGEATDDHYVPLRYKEPR